MKKIKNFLKLYFGYLVIGLVLIQCKKTDNSDLTIDIDYNSETVKFEHFWKGTGLTPAETLLDKDMQQNLNFMGGSGNHGIKYIRPHFMLNFVCAKGIETENPVYNWAYLDSVTDLMLDNGLTPIFELMAYPSSDLKTFRSTKVRPDPMENYFDNYDFEDMNKVRAFKRFIRDVLLHLAERYGEEELKTWYFESTNEPDFRGVWPEKGYLNYFDACVEGIKESGLQITWGGPGTDQALRTLGKVLIQHCDTGINCLTGERGVRIDYVSIHAKALPDSIIIREKEALDYIRQNHPRFANIPFLNNEADPSWGWDQPFWWRPTAWYPAFIVESASKHLKFMTEEKINYPFLSNDNAFLGDWYYRSYHARFADPENSSNFSMIKKPCYTVMSLLSMVGNQAFDIEVPEKYKKHLGVFASKNDNEGIYVMVYNKPEIPIRINYKAPIPDLSDSVRAIIEKQDVSIHLNLNNLPFKNPVIAEYRLDKDNGSAYKTWLNQGEPAKPPIAQLKEMQATQEPTMTINPENSEIKGNSASISLDMPYSSVSLIVINEKPAEKPETITNLKTYIYTGVNGNPEIVLRWDQVQNDGFLSYEVWSAPAGSEEFIKINPANLLDACFVHRAEGETAGTQYKVRAVDIAGNEGEFSDVLTL